MRAFPFDASRANERDLLGYAMMEGLRQDRGRPVTCMALEEKESMQWVIVGCEDTTVRALDGDTGQLLWTYAGFAGLVRSLTVAGAGNDDINLVVCGMGDSSVISLDMDPVHPAAAGQPSLVGRGLRGLRAEREPRLTSPIRGSRPRCRQHAGPHRAEAQLNSTTLRVTTRVSRSNFTA